MTAAALATNPNQPGNDAASFHSRLDQILPLINEKAREAETLGRLTDDVVAALRKAGLYTMMFPREVGGAELNPVEFISLLERIAYAHGSTGWCTMISTAEGVPMAIYLDQKGIDTVFKNGPDITIAGNGVPRGYARPVEGGYMIKGNWAYGSAIYHAEWIHSGCFVMDADGKEIQQTETGAPQIIVAHHPASTIKLLGNWDVLGLRATGSFDYTLASDEELFVPDYMVYNFYDNSGPKRGSAQGNIGLVGYTALCHTAWAIGAGRRILDETAEVIRKRQDPFGKSAESATFKFKYAQAEARYRAARALAYESWQAIVDRSNKNEKPTQDEMTLIKLSLRHIHDVVSEVGLFCYREARGAALHNTALQLVFRDINASTQHILLADQIVEECGRGLLGLSAKDAQWSVFGIDG